MYSKTQITLQSFQWNCTKCPVLFLSRLLLCDSIKRKKQLSLLPIHPNSVLKIKKSCLIFVKMFLTKTGVSPTQVIFSTHIFSLCMKLFSKLPKIVYIISAMINPLLLKLYISIFFKFWMRNLNTKDLSFSL